MTRGQKLISTRTERIERAAQAVACQRGSLMQYYTLAVRLGFSVEQAHDIWQRALATPEAQAAMAA